VARVEPFEAHADRYEEWFDTHSAVYLSELDAIQTLLPGFKTGIEIGVGTGRFAAPLGIKTGMDPSPAMMRIARRRGIIVLDAVAEALPFTDGQFDLALMVTTICFVDDIDQSFHEVYRILSDGGFFLIGFIDRDSALGMDYQKRKGESIFYKIADFYNVSEVESSLRKAGFRDFEYSQTLFHPLKEIKRKEPVLEGHGKGSFVVVRCRKKIPRKEFAADSKPAKS
jgi:SAM-dependent methyltransferase